MNASEAVRRVTGLRLGSWEVREEIDRIATMPNRNAYINREVEKFLKRRFPGEIISLDIVEAVVRHHFTSIC